MYHRSVDVQFLNAETVFNMYMCRIWSHNSGPEKKNLGPSAVPLLNEYEDERFERSAHQRHYNSDEKLVNKANA